MTFIAILLVTADTAAAQTPIATPSPTPVPADKPSLEHEFFKNILRDQKAIWTAPLRLERSDAKWLVPSGIGTMALITTDRMTGDEIAESDGQRNASRIISYAGSIYGIAVAAGTFYFVGRATHNARARETGILSAEAAIDTAIVVGALKGVTQRERPSGGSERSEFFDGGSSFPSGHSAGAWTVATIVADEYHHRRSVQIAAYGIATAVSLARFTGGNHYLSDVLVGSAIGFGIGQYVYHAHHREAIDTDFFDPTAQDGPRKRWPMIAPQYSRQAREYGVALTWKF
jgi:hypothetical protein